MLVVKMCYEGGVKSHFTNSFRGKVDLKLNYERLQ